MSGGTKEAVRHFRPQASSLVRAHEQDIREWLQQKTTWAVITSRLDPSGELNEAAVIMAYRRLERYRYSDKRVEKIQWLHSNYAQIEMMLQRGDEWFFILKTLNYPIGHGSFALEIGELEREFEAMSERALNHQKAAVHLVVAEVAETTTEAVSPKKTPDGADTAKPQVDTAKADSTTADSAVGRIKPKPGTFRTDAERLGLTPKHNPFESAQELRERVHAANRKSGQIYNSSRGLPEEERKVAMQRHKEASREYDQLNVDYLYRFSDFKAKYSKFHLLAGKALECGAFEVVDAESENAIMLQGYDRPEAIEGLDEVPEPLFIRENLTAEELGKIEEAYKTDGREMGKRTPLVRLAEALCLRGEYLVRFGWHEYDTLIRLEGDDFPAPTLCNANVWDIRSRAIELWPKLTGDEPVQPSEYERKRLTYRPDPELEKRGEWK